MQPVVEVLEDVALLVTHLFEPKSAELVSDGDQLMNCYQSYLSDLHYPDWKAVSLDRASSVCWYHCQPHSQPLPKWALIRVGCETTVAERDAAVVVDR